MLSEICPLGHCINLKLDFQGPEGFSLPKGGRISVATSARGAWPSKFVYLLTTLQRPSHFKNQHSLKSDGYYSKKNSSFGILFLLSSLSKVVAGIL
jgi:hypothetical protein